ncbi:hypothetical protein GCM10020220_023780 [Nonomuraea rubra]|uniref:DUF6289 family protein n=1 Tax=Nonomuraea rubra TaxID=46180 RepID=UPI00336D02BA
MIRRALLAAALAAATLGVLPVAAANARACRIDHYCTTTYYSDAALTNAVGGKQEDCDGPPAPGESAAPIRPGTKAPASDRRPWVCVPPTRDLNRNTCS